MMRPSDHHYSPIDSRWRRASRLPIGIIELRPELRAAALEPHRWPGHFGDLHAVKVRQDRLWRRNLRHPAVVRVAPSFVLARMTGLARDGRSIAVVCDLN